MKAVKGNKQYTIDETQKKFYQDGGFDIYDDAGELISYGRDKKVPYEEYAALKKELEELKQGGETKAEEPAVLEILRKYASEHGINLGNASSVSGIMKKIKAVEEINLMPANTQADG